MVDDFRARQIFDTVLPAFDFDGEFGCNDMENPVHTSDHRGPAVLQEELYEILEPLYFLCIFCTPRIISRRPRYHLSHCTTSTATQEILYTYQVKKYANCMEPPSFWT